MKIVTISAIYLHAEKETSIRYGHPWVFPKAIARESGKCITGELVEVFDSKGQAIALGVYNEHSLYRVRILLYTYEMLEEKNLRSIITYRLTQAIALRKNLGLPSTDTTAYRLFNSEGDGLSGLTIDCFNETCVVVSSAYWVEANRSLISETILLLTGLKRVIWQSQTKVLQQEGWLEAAKIEGSGKEVVKEAGVAYEVDFSTNQKTGLFLDQRENHQRIAALAQGKRVLDLYSYTGGFALHAAKGGAASVMAIDSSDHAIALAQRNAQLNHLENIHFQEGDARDYLTKAGDYDLIILDPPKLVPSRRHIERAKNYYRFLHREIFKAMRPGTLLMTCNCSSALTTAEFAQLVSYQAVLSNKVARVLGVYGPALCHPTLTAFPEGQYLTALLIAVV